MTCDIPHDDPRGEGPAGTLTVEKDESTVKIIMGLLYIVTGHGEIKDEGPYTQIGQRVG